MTPFRTRRGRIAYVSDLDRNRGAEWGHETFSITQGPDGMRVAHIHCELEFEGLKVARDIVQSMRPDYHPHDGYVRLMVDGAFKGAASYRFSETECVMAAFGEQEGAVSQRFLLGPKPVRGLGTHALISDGWAAAGMNFKAGPYRQSYERNVVVSLHHLGATGPGITPTNTALEYLGDETITTSAGTFACHKVAYVGMTANNHPPYVMWLTTDGDFLFVKGVVEGYLASVFELVELTG